ncbi:MAG: bifunctional phosphopantothenoylcysteine decarboxylase/phosphopantothenate--cysteine ligase CoaBC [Fusobacteriaceae bacterium]|nr:bifunctional phosphopantothenoylcysteine decarboxylase/phosphopantothenate--cysteine ligase CoaBC [Fusobacteriaceae bacterium]
MKNILLGVSGGIAAYKSANIISKLKKRNYNVRVIMTKNATEIITPLTLETLARDRVIVDMWAEKSNYDVEHISLADWADIILVAPTTLNIVGKIANGIADDMLTTVISASKAPVFFALAMNVNMYENPILNENILKLKKYGYKFIEADEGFLACNVNAKGRLKDEEEIVELIDSHFQNKKVLIGKKILITAGRTEESLDPIRYLSNRSSGKMGYSLAKVCKEYGAEVTLVSGPSSIDIPENIEFISTTSALDMYAAVKNKFNSTDIFISTAAVADYRPKNISDKKIKKKDGELIIELERNPDILFEMGKLKKNQTLIGFCAESENLIENAIGKLEKKNLDYIVANSVGYFAKNENKAFIINKKQQIEELEEMDKEILAFTLINKILLGENN